MNRIEQFQETIDRLKVIIENNLQGHEFAEHLLYGLEYCVKVEREICSDLSLLKTLCTGPLPFKEVEAFDEKTINSFYKSFAEMKVLHEEKSRE